MNGINLPFPFYSASCRVINLDILALNQHLFLQTYIRKYTYNKVAQADTKFVQPSKVYWDFWFIGFLISEAKMAMDAHERPDVFELQGDCKTLG